MVKRLVLWQICFATITCTFAASFGRLETYCPIFYPDANAPKNCRKEQPDCFLFNPPPARPSTNDSRVLEDAFNALKVLQDVFFQSEVGTWPRAIDWTAAVMQTGLSGMMTTLSQALEALNLGGGSNSSQAKENLINALFSQVIGSYFGQDALAIRNEVLAPTQLLVNHVSWSSTGF
jgi:hypothetical protein